MSEVVKAPVTKWLAGPDGIVKYTPPLTKWQRYAGYQRALLKISTVFRQAGFVANADDSFNSISLEHPAFMFDLKLEREMPNVAYVTSHPGYHYEEKTTGQTPDIEFAGVRIKGQKIYGINATVITLADELKKSGVAYEFILRLIVSKGASHPPVFIPLPNDIDDPEAYLTRQVLLALSELAKKFPSLHAHSRTVFALEEVRELVLGDSCQGTPPSPD